MCGPAPGFTAAYSSYYRRGKPLSPSHLGIFRERSRYLHDTFVLSPARPGPGLERLCNHGHPQTLAMYTIRCERIVEEWSSYQRQPVRTAAFAGIRRKSRQSNGA